MKLKQNKNISVSKSHNYTVEKVKYAMDFLKRQGRNTTLDEWVEVYNYVKGTNETAKGCQRCAAAKFKAGVNNYAHYGYMTLINEGHSSDEFTDAASKDVERIDKPKKAGRKSSDKAKKVDAQVSVEQMQDSMDAASSDGAASQSDVQRDAERGENKENEENNDKSED